MRTLGGILKTGGIADLTRVGWPTLRAGLPPMSFLNAMREMRATVTRRSPGNAMPVIAVIGAGASEDRSIAALNFALAAARDGAKVLMIDADHATHALSNKVSGLGKSEAEPARLAQYRQQGFARDHDRQRHLDPARDQGDRRQDGRRHPQGDRTGALHRRPRPRDCRRTGDALVRAPIAR